MVRGPLNRPGIPTLKLADRSEDPAWDRYLSSCHDYLRRQILVYQNWPQRRITPVGYAPEKVFRDMNA